MILWDLLFGGAVPGWASFSLPQPKPPFRSSAAEAYPPEMNRRLAETFTSVVAASDPLVAWAAVFPDVHVPEYPTEGGWAHFAATGDCSLFNATKPDAGSQCKASVYFHQSEIPLCGVACLKVFRRYACTMFKGCPLFLLQYDSLAAG